MILCKKKYLTAILFLSAIFLFRQSCAQTFLGLGTHIQPPVHIDHCCNSFVEVTPGVVPGFSATIKRRWKNAKDKAWYYEFGLQNVGVKVRVVDYLNKQVGVWIDSMLDHIGFPSALFGLGRIFSLTEGKYQSEAALGIESSYRISHTLGLLGTHSFALDYLGEEVTFPLFLRLHLGYAIRFKFFDKIPGHIQLYTNLSLQKIARGPHTLLNPETGVAVEGIYYLNNSEVGIKIFTDLSKEHYSFPLIEKKRNKQGAGLKKKARWSLEGQLYRPPPTDYFIPQVDSFSVSGLNISSTLQIGVKTEFFNFRNERWSTLVSLGVGVTTQTDQFIAIAEFTRDGLPLNNLSGLSPLGVHLIPGVGIAYKHLIEEILFQHTFSTTYAIPLTKEDDTIFASEASLFQFGAPISSNLFVAEFSHKYGRNRFLFGLEYQPEWVLNPGKPIFFALGLVFNYSWGIISQGRVTVNNGRTRYNGGITQRFSKIGITARIGFNPNNKKVYRKILQQ